MNGRLSLLSICAALAIGCSQEQPKTTSGVGAPPSEAKTTDTGGTAEATPKLADVPPAYQHDAYAWYGLGNGKPIKMKLTQDGTPQEGEQKFELEKLEKDRAVFHQVWSGGLSFYGDARYSVDAKGIWGIEAQGTKVDPPQMELPATLTPGFAWSSPDKLDVAGGSISDLKAKIVGVGKLKLGDRTIDALQVHRTSTITIGGKPQQMAVSEFYEKGIGAVKMVVDITGGGKPKKSFTMVAIP